MEKFNKNGKTYCGCGTEINESDAMCPLCTESYEVDDKMRQYSTRYGAGMGTSGNIQWKGKLSIPLAPRDTEAWTTPDNAR